MNHITQLTEKTNMVLGAIVAVLSYIFGQYWFLFLAFLLLNCGDFLSRWIAARINGDECSRRCWIGLAKKLGYWLMIALAFGMSVIFIKLGDIIGVSLGVTTLLGWFVLGSLIINEIRSILENLVDAKLDVPIFLTKGLAVANKAMDAVADALDGDEDVAK